MLRQPTKQTVNRTVPEAFELANKEALGVLIDDGAVAKLALSLAEEDGVVFIDEIDKVVADAAAQSADVSSLGVQQDLLPLIEGSTVTLKDGTAVNTANVLFVCSGAFHSVKPSDMIAELQGRLPVRVELQGLTEKDFVRILTEPTFNLLRQQSALLATEGITANFTDDGVKALASVASEMNATAQNIGARRLNTILERVMDEVSFDCDKFAGQTIEYDAARVKEATGKLVKNLDLARYIL
jgi:ATP-dependent protease HslVU ATPase subunit